VGRPFVITSAYCAQSERGERAEVVDLDALTDEVYVKLDMLRPLGMHRVGRHVYNRDVVREDYRGLVDGAMKFTEKLPNPDTLLCRIGHRPVLRLGAPPRHSWLAFGGLGDERIPKENVEAGRPTPSVRAARPVSVGVRREGELGGCTEV
jgi:hypothetical protein